MALQKEIRQEDGVVTKYHRVSFVVLATNKRNSIAVLSYVDEIARDEEKASSFMQPYRKSITYEIPYDSTMTVEKAYEYLKTLPQYEGSIDI